MRIAALVVVSYGFLVAPAFGASNPIQAENARPGTPGWASIRPTTEIEGFADHVSVAPGEAIGFHVAGNVLAAPRYRIDIYRLGWYGGVGGRLVACLPACGGDRETVSRPPVPPADPETGEVRAGWPTTDTLGVPADWLSGYYEARIHVTSGSVAGHAHPVYFVVRAPSLRPSAVLVQAPVNTWQAYNNWGGKSLYGFNSTGDLRANHVSFDRPYMLPPVPGAQATPLAWEVQLVRFLEREGYDVSYQTDVDTDREPTSLLRHRLVMTAGHSEYWTMNMRRGFDTARDQGTNLAFVGSNNAYWHVRYERSARTMVAYKSWADPITDPAMKTVLFRDLDLPECALVGVMHLDSLGRTDYSVNAPALGDPWFRGTGFTSASTLPGLVGLEFDAVPAFPPSGCAQPGLIVFFHHEGPPGNADAVRYVAPSGARVFASGTMQWSWALDDFGGLEYGHGPPDPRVQQFMRNALEDLVRPAAPSSLTTRAGVGVVAVTTAVRADPRVREVVVVRHEGADLFDPSGGSAEAVCGSTDCLDRGVLGHRIYRYAAFLRDDWGVSQPIFSEAVEVPNTPPRARLRGPTRAVASQRLVFRVVADDRDGDTLLYRWRVDRREPAARGPVLVVRLRKPGSHRVSVTVRDGHNGTARHELRVRVRSGR